MSFIADIIETIVDLVVEVVTAIIDLVVDIVEAVIEAVASLLGFNADDQVVEYFEVYNQALFSSSIVDSGLSQTMIASALYNDIDINSAIYYNAIFGDSIPKSLKEFIKYIDDGNYYTGFPDVESFLNYVDEGEVVDVLNVIHGTPTSIDSAVLGRLTIPTWIEWWLYTNKGYNLDTNYIGTVDVYYNNATYNTATDDYTIPTSTGTLPYNVPTKPVGAHVIANYHLDSAPTSRLLFKYKIGEGTYPDLDSSETNLDLSSSTLKTLPAVPIRLNNTNYTGTARETQITDLLAKVKLDGEGILAGITDDYGGPMSDLDHIYVNFGVRMVDTSQGGLQYLFRLFENLHSSNAVTEADYTAATGDKPYNNIIITHDDYKYIFKYAFTNFSHYTLSAVNADTDLSNIYYSKTNHFDDSNLLVKPYYASSSQLMYKVQYQADNSSEVASFLSGSGVLAPGTPTTEGVGKLQVTTRIAHTGTIYASDGTDSGQSVLKPDLVYEGTGGGDIFSDTRVHCIDHYLYVRYNGAGKVEIAGAEPSGTVHTGRGDCGGVAQGWYTAVDESISGYTDIRIQVTGSSTGGGGGSYDNTFSVGSSLGNTVVGATYGASGAQQPSIEVIVTFSPSTGGSIKIVNSVNEETTHSQEITYYEIVANGLNSYKVKAPIAALNVIDADSGKFKLVKFNLANPDDLMLPFFYGALPNVTANSLSSMWLASAHVSTYIARYEVIESNGGGFLKLLIMIIIIVVIMIYTGAISPSSWGVITETAVVDGVALTTNATGQIIATDAAGSALAAGELAYTTTNSFGVVTKFLAGSSGVVGAGSVAWSSTMMNFATSFATNQLISYAIQAVAKDISPELAMVLGVFLQFKFGMGQGIDFSKALSIEDGIRITTIVVDTYSGVETIKYDSKFEAEELIRQNFATKLDTGYKDLELAYLDIEEFLNLGDHMIPGLQSDTRAYMVPEYPDSFYIMALGTIEMSTHIYEFDYIMNQGYSFDLQETYI